MQPGDIVRCIACRLWTTPEKWQARAPRASLSDDAGAISRATAAALIPFPVTDQANVVLRASVRDFVLVVLRAAEAKP